MPSKPLVKTPKRSEQTRLQVLLEAERLYAHGGYDAINLQTVAEQVGVTKAALFYHFANKQALFVAMLETMLARYGGIITEHFAKPKNSSEAQFLALSWALSAQPMFDAFRFLRSEQQYLLPEQQVQLQQVCTEKLFRPIKQAFALALERQEVQLKNVSAASSMFLGFCVLVSSMRGMEKGGLSAAGHREMFAMFWHGMARG